ncbi:hypothetical protein A0H81_06827 [Grifola frondosa]|uniref:Uncharacterized protein n=1 Tax=Grifola frondosa TaxID=5627 RepID=A0A1C7M995_GRIFR|nr:hypothetical protein A0H81_06827 [Grifola frondosa]
MLNNYATILYINPRKFAAKRFLVLDYSLSPLEEPRAFCVSECTLLKYGSSVLPLVLQAMCVDCSTMSE